MESKRAGFRELLTDLRVLLIEPVWNRNKKGDDAWDALGYLLIEPVWNRNTNVFEFAFSIENAFNRTSMESKHFKSYVTFRDVFVTFNRTSMESKPSLI